MDKNAMMEITIKQMVALRLAKLIQVGNVRGWLANNPYASLIVLKIIMFHLRTMLL